MLQLIKRSSDTKRKPSPLAIRLLLPEGQAIATICILEGKRVAPAKDGTIHMRTGASYTVKFC